MCEPFGIYYLSGAGVTHLAPLRFLGVSGKGRFIYLILLGKVFVKNR